MTVALTGGTGFFGTALVRHAVQAGARLRALVRRAADDERLQALGAQVVRGDLSHAGGSAGLVEAGDTVIHAAARVELTGPWQAFERGTVAITRHLLANALSRGPARFVYVSSAAVYSSADSPNGVCAERTPARPDSANLYGQAKLAAENCVREQCEAAGCPWTIVRLGFLYGPNNRALFDRLALFAARRRLFLLGDGQNRIATLYNDDAADAVWRAATHPAAVGRIYDAAAAEPVTQAQFLNAHLALMGHGELRRRLPPGFAYAATGVVEYVSRLLRLQPAISRAMVRLMSTDQVVDATRLQTELAWQPQVSFSEGMRRTGAWLNEVTGERATSATGATGSVTGTDPA